MKLQPSTLFVALTLALVPASIRSQQLDHKPLTHLEYPPEFSAEQILNGDLPGRPPSPPATPVRVITDGFAADRVFHVPPPGVHPRILFAPQDLPQIRERIRTTRSGSQLMSFVRQQLAKGIDRRGTWENQLYQLLLDGKIDEFARLYRPQDVAIVAGNSLVPATITPGAKWHHRDPFGQALEMKAFLCLLDNDETQGREIAKVATAFALYFKPRVEAAAAQPYGKNWWRSMRSAVDGYPFLPFIYDFEYNFMTPQQQSTVRGVLSLITAGRYTLGMELPPHWRVWNFIGLSVYEALFSLAIEGEKGYDPRIYKRVTEVARDYLTYGVNPTGMAHESVGYHSGGLEELSVVMIAMANRGDNLFITDRYREQFHQWFLETLQPYGGEWFSDGDLGNFPVGTEAAMIAKYFYPRDSRVDFVFQNLPQVISDNFQADLYPLETLLTASDPIRDPNGKLADYKSGSTFNLPLTYTDNDRGVTITRNNWTSDTLYLNFECHPDTHFASHDHADRGRFVLSALGRNWAWQDSRPHETGQTNSVLIDDLGQGFFPTYATWLGVEDSPASTFAGCDAKYAYDWKWQKEAAMWAEDDPRWTMPSYKALRDNLKLIPSGQAEYDPSPQIEAFYKPYLTGYPKFWDEDSWVVRQVNNPVLCAFRNAGIVRGSHPYALITDDIRKDDATHTYKWLMQLEEDLQIEHQSASGGVRLILLKEQKGNRRLAVYVFDEELQPEAYTEHYDTEYRLNGQSTQRPTMYRLTVPVKSVSLHSRVLLYPFREGETLPAATWDPHADKIALHGTDLNDEIRFSVGKSGRTTLQVMRDGKFVADVH